MSPVRSRRWLVITAVVCLVALAALTGFLLMRRGSARGVSRLKVDRPNVLLVTLDTTRADHIGAYGYAAAQTPALDALAADGVLFEHCITPTAYTLPAHSSIMTGLYPPSHGVRINGDTALAASNTTLAERLSAEGYRTGAFVAAFVLDGRWGLSQGFQHYDDNFPMAADQKLDLARVQRPANAVADAALKWLGEDRTRPFFAWVHFYDAHVPYEPPEPFRSRFAGRGTSGAYDGEIAFADSQLNRLLQWLERNRLKDNTIVVIVGDHGEGLGDHGESEHGYYIYDYAVHVPLIVRLPGTSLKGVRVGAQVRTIDIEPTIMQLVAGQAGQSLDGTSLLPLLDGREEKLRTAYSESMATYLQYGWAALYSLRTNDYKFIEAPRSELYDLKSDPAEQANRLDDNRRVARELKDELTRLREATAKRTPKAEEANLDAETVRKLASLGYLGGGSSPPKSDQNLADPKDKMHLFDSVGYAANLIAKDDYKQATQVLEIVLNDDPHVAQAQLLLATCYQQTKQPQKAKAILDAYLREDPGNVRALIGMAEVLLQEGKSDDVLAICRRALAKDDKNARAYELMADVYIARDDHRDALPLLQKVVEIQPKLTRSRNNLAVCFIGTGRLDDADALLRSITKEHPKWPLANFHLALLRERQGRAPEAVSAYRKELEYHPKSVVARFNLGDLLLRMGDSVGAEKEMRTLIAEDPANARPYLVLGQLLLNDASKLPEVEKLARQGLERADQPELKALGYFLLADVFSREGRRGELEEALKRGQYYRSQIKS